MSFIKVDLKSGVKGTTVHRRFHSHRIEPGASRFGTDGSMYDIMQDGDIVGCRDKHATHGDVRMFWETDDHGRDKPVFYVFDRKFKSFPFIAPYVWWRRIEFDMPERMKELEKFVDELALIKNHNGWQGTYFKRARDISKKGFLMKLKGEYDGTR